MPPASRKRQTPQMTTAMPDRLRRKAVAIAKLEGESDYLGAGYAAVVRRETAKYVAKRIDKWRDHPDFPDDLRED